MLEILQAMHRSLNHLEVKGRDNLDILLGLIQATEQLIKVFTPKEEKPNDDHDQQGENV